MKKINALILAGSIGLAAQAQTVIDPLTGSLAGYTTTAILDNGLGNGAGVTFASSASGLSASYTGPGATAEQSLLLAPASSFSTTFAVGDMLTVNVAMPTSSIVEDFGLAIAATPVAASAGNSWNSRTAFDYATISYRPSQTAIRANSSISGTLTTANGVITGVAAPTVSELFIAWNSVNSFTLGYVDSSSVYHNSETISFSPSSVIGTEIGFYGDLRNSGGTTLSYLSNLTIQPVPEPSTLAMAGMSLFGLFAVVRRKK
jgi:hypothetical protein